jgi:hypothetical protein
MASGEWREVSGAGWQPSLRRKREPTRRAAGWQHCARECGPTRRGPGWQHCAGIRAGNYPAPQRIAPGEIAAGCGSQPSAPGPDTPGELALLGQIYRTGVNGAGIQIGTVSDAGPGVS